MGEIIFFILIIIPALVGIGELLHIIKVLIISPKHRAKKYIAVELSGNEALEQLISVAYELAWQGREYGENVIAINCGLDSEAFEECYEYCRKKGYYFCSEEKFKGILE